MLLVPVVDPLTLKAKRPMQGVVCVCGLFFFFLQFFLLRFGPKI